MLGIIDGIKNGLSGGAPVNASLGGRLKLGKTEGTMLGVALGS